MSLPPPVADEGRKGWRDSDQRERSESLSLRQIRLIVLIREYLKLSFCKNACDTRVLGHIGSLG